MQSVMEPFSGDDINNLALFYAVQKPRRNSMMRAMTALLSEGEIEDIAAYYATRPRAPAAISGR